MKSNKVLSIVIFLLFQILVVIVYNSIVIEAIMSSDIWLRDVLCFQYFNMFGYNSKWVSMAFFIMIFLIMHAYQNALYHYSYKLVAGFFYFGPLIQHYLVSTLLLLVFTPVLWNKSYIQQALYMNGDYLLIIPFSFFVLFVLKIVWFLKSRGKISIDEIMSTLFYSNNESIRKDDVIKLDQLDISNTVEAILDYEILNKDLSKPNIVCLQGKWGSGKTYIMESLKQRIEKEKTTPYVKYTAMNKSRKIYRRIQVIYTNIHQYDDKKLLHLYFINEIINKIERKTILPRLDKINIAKALSTQLINGIEVDKLLNRNTKLPKVDEYLRTISRWLEQIDICVLYMIDDADRLIDKCDLDNLLKLITLVNANMKNIVMIVALDTVIFQNILNEDHNVTAQKKYSSNDIVQKYFNSEYSTKEISPDRLWGIIHNQIHRTLTKYEIDTWEIEDILKKEEQATEAFNVLEKNTLTIRGLQKYLEILTYNLSQYKIDINIWDIILLSFVQTFKKKLFSQMKVRSEILSISPDVLNYEYTLMLTNRIEKYKNIYREFISEGELTESEIKILYILFPQIKIILDKQSNNVTSIANEIKSIYKNGEADCRIYIYPYIETIIKNKNVVEFGLITSRNYRNRILKELNKSDYNKEVCIKLLDEFFSKDVTDRNIRRIALNWVSDRVKNDNPIVKKNLLHCMAHIAKILNSEDVNFFGLSEKKTAEFLTIDFIKTERPNYSVILEILSEYSNSDSFSDRILLFTVSKESTTISLEEEWRRKYVDAYINRVNTKVNKYKDPFNELHYDEMPVSLWRWKQAIDYCHENGIVITLSEETIKNRIISSINGSIKHVNILTKYSFEETDEGNYVFSSKSIPFIEDNALHSLVKRYLMESEIGDPESKRIIALKKWTESKEDQNK